MPKKKRPKSAAPAQTLDCRGLLCPLPILEAARVLRSLTPPFTLIILSDDPAARKDFAAFTKKRKLRLEIKPAADHDAFLLLN